ncbi:MAG: hypothetical protein ABSB86_17045 [Bryobacteraceae bacterium]
MRLALAADILSSDSGTTFAMMISVNRGLEYNLGAVGVTQAVRQAHGQSRTLVVVPGTGDYNVEVVQSQESVAGAELDYINSVFAHNVAKLSLARSVGQAGDNLAEFLQTR